MQPRLLKQGVGQYVPSQWTGQNESGAVPIGDCVLVLPDIAAEKIGGLLMTEDLRERHTLASETGTLVAVADGAFLWTPDRSRPYAGTKPKPGDRVYFQRYAGQVLTGDDGLTYRSMSDTCIGAIKAVTP